MYLLTDVPKEILESLDIIINKKNQEKANDNLAGNLQLEFIIPEGKEILRDFIFSLKDLHLERFPSYFAKVHTMINTTNKEFSFDNLWVNFQSKYEFNPIHRHNGLFSFVIWHKIPYTLQDENSFFPNMKEDDVRAGRFCFFYTDVFGEIQHDTLPVDKTYEGKIAFFPANLYHCVYPFYTSDKYRISISGNVGLKL